MEKLFKPARPIVQARIMKHKCFGCGTLTNGDVCGCVRSK